MRDIRLKNLLDSLVNGILTIIYQVTKILRNPFIRVKGYLYSRWIGLSFSQHCIYFKYPINQIEGASYFTIGTGCCFGKYAVLTAWGKRKSQKFNPQVRIGNNCQFGDYLHLTCINEIIIKDGVLTGRWVTITDNSHGNSSMTDLILPPTERSMISKGKVIIEQNVWIGDKTTILPGVCIGEGSIIAANSVVTRDVPPFSVAGGNPIRIIKQLNI